MTDVASPHRGERYTDRAGGFHLVVTREALSAARTALQSQPAGTAVRVFAELGVRPRVGMLLGRSRPDDLVVDADEIQFVIDPSSTQFLEEAIVDYVDEGGHAGFSVTGPNAPTAPSPPADASAGAAIPSSGSGGRPEVEDAVRKSLRQVYDPEIPMNIVDLGLIYGMEWGSEGELTLRMTMTSPGCPVADLLAEAVRAAAAAVPGVGSVKVDVVWEPVWGPEKMSEFAKRQLGFA